MKPIHYLGLLLFATVFMSVSLVMTVVITRHAVQQALASLDGQRAEAQATFTDKDEAVIEFPAVVRGRRIQCTVYVNTKRKASSVFC